MFWRNTSGVETGGRKGLAETRTQISHSPSALGIRIPGYSLICLMGGEMKRTDPRAAVQETDSRTPLCFASRRCGWHVPPRRYTQNMDWFHCLNSRDHESRYTVMIPITLVDSRTVRGHAVSVGIVHSGILRSTFPSPRRFFFVVHTPHL